MRIDQYVSFILTVPSAKVDDFDIIVFPESTLNSVENPFRYPDQRANINPCDDKSGDYESMRKLSCAARNSKRYVVINVTTKRNCTEDIKNKNVEQECTPPHDMNMYNTNVVFDRQGSIIST